MDWTEQKQIQDSLPDIVDITSHPSFYWERDATQQYLTKNGWDQALEDTRRLLVSCRNRCVRLEQAINNINRVLQEETYFPDGRK